MLSGDSWDQMMTAEKSRVKKLDQKFAALLTEHKVDEQTVVTYAQS